MFILQSMVDLEYVLSIEPDANEIIYTDIMSEAKKFTHLTKSELYWLTRNSFELIKLEIL